MAKLTAPEIFVLDTLADAYNRFIELPNRSGSDNNSFADAIHRAQHLIALRVARRADPDMWNQP